MKKYNILAICVLLLSGFMSSCYDDKGNYDYDWANTVRFAEMRDTSVDRGTVVKITPNMMVEDGELLRKENPDDYTYTWVAQKMNTGSYTDTLKYLLSTKHTLDDTIWLDIRTEPYLVTYTVKDKKNSDLQWTAKFKLKVNRRVSEGFLFLTEEEDTKKVELDIYARRSDGTTFLEKGVLARSGFPYAGGGANRVFYQNHYNDANKKLWIATGETTGWLEVINLKWNEKYLAKSIMVEPTPISYTFANILVNNNTEVFYVSKTGAIHYMNNYNIISSSASKFNGKDFEAYPSFGRNMSYGNLALIYNKTDKCFVSYSINSMTVASECTSLPENEAAKGMELLYMQSIRLANRTIAILKNPSTGELFLYNYVITYGRLALEFKMPLTNPGNLEQAEHFIFDNDNGFLYYSIGKQLYNYRQGEGSKPIDELDAPITAMSVLNLGYNGYQNEYTKSIIVATYDESAGGKVRLFQPDPSESKRLLPYGESMENLGRVKDIDYLK